jgi:hypothetical protein
MINERLLLKFLDGCIDIEKTEGNPERLKAYQNVRIFLLALIVPEDDQKDKVSDLFE